MPSAEFGAECACEGAKAHVLWPRGQSGCGMAGTLRGLGASSRSQDVCGERLFPAGRPGGGDLGNQCRSQAVAPCPGQCVSWTEALSQPGLTGQPTLHMCLGQSCRLGALECERLQCLEGQGLVGPAAVQVSPCPFPVLSPCACGHTATAATSTWRGTRGGGQWRTQGHTCD